MTYVAVEGVIGAGKTTLARLLQPVLGAQVVLEVFEENPFLSSFYEDRARYAFQTQIFFLLSRYRQQRSLRMAARPLVSDYIFAKDALFARLNLAWDELTMYERVHDALAEQIETPSLVVFLRADTDLLMARILQRDRPYERNMDPAYIESLRRAYDGFFAAYRDAPVLTLDAARYDFVASDTDRDAIMSRVLAALGQAPRQEALPGFSGDVTTPGWGIPLTAPGEEAPAVPPPAPALAESERRLRDFQQFHRWLDGIKRFDTDPYFNFILLQEEVGELAALMKARWLAGKGEAPAPALEQVGAEMADVLAYLLKLANYLGVDLETAYLEKMARNQGREWR